MKRWHLTDAEKAEIRRLTRARVRQSEIAPRLGITAPSVSKAQRKMGLPTKLPTPEAKIVALFNKGVPGLEISKRLHCPANRVWAVRRKHGIRRNRERGRRAKRDIAGFCEAIKRREGHVRPLARRFGSSDGTAYAIAHSVVGRGKFKGGPATPPMSSVFPVAGWNQNPTGTGTHTPGRRRDRQRSHHAHNRASGLGCSVRPVRSVDRNSRISRPIESRVRVGPQGSGPLVFEIESPPYGGTIP
jgi:hypothetical protein